MPFISNIDLSLYEPIDGKLPDYCLSRLPNLKKVTLPETTKAIGNGSFLGDAREFIVIPSGVEYIGSNAFSNFNGIFDAVTLSSVFC